MELISENNGFYETEDWSVSFRPRPTIKVDYFEDATPSQKEIILKELSDLVNTLRNCYHRVHCIDYYLSGDLGADSYLNRLNSYNK